MAQLAVLGLASAGAVTGGLLFGPTGASAGWLVGSTVGSLLFQEKLKEKGPRLSDLKVQDSAYGKHLPIVFGAMRVAGEVIWATDIEAEENQAEVGGKGFGGGTEVTTVSYFANFAVSLCEGPIQAVRRVWADSQLIVDFSRGPTRARPTNTAPSTTGSTWAARTRSPIRSSSGSRGWATCRATGARRSSCSAGCPWPTSAARACPTSPPRWSGSPARPSPTTPSWSTRLCRPTSPATSPRTSCPTSRASSSTPSRAPRPRASRARPRTGSGSGSRTAASSAMPRASTSTMRPGSTTPTGCSRARSR